MKKHINIFSPVNSCCGKFEIISVSILFLRDNHMASVLS